MRRLALVAVLGLAVPGAASSDAPAADVCAQASAAGKRAIERRARLAGYYAHKLVLVDGRVYEWEGDGPLRLVAEQASHVAAGRSRGYAIDAKQRAIAWRFGSRETEVILEQVALLSAGDSGLLAIRCDGSLWQRKAGATAWEPSAAAAVHAWVGDSADYYIDPDGRLYARGLAHRGQYGDGRLVAEPGWTPVARDARFVVAHTGHALYLRSDGAVLGTGGNVYGPLGKHGHGDKAATWGVVFDGARAIATGSRHSLALEADGSLWIWGAEEGLEARRVMKDVAEMAAGMDDTVALDVRGRLWNWRVGQRPAPQMQLPQPR